MFDAFTPPSLATLPRQGIGARIASRLGRMGAALHGVVCGRLRRRRSGADSRIGPEIDGSTTAMPARAPRAPRHRPMVVPEQYQDLAFTAEAFPDLTPAAREFFNTPMEQCDPAMLGLVLEALAGAIAGMITPQDGMRDARDVFLAMNSRLGALTGGMQGTPPETITAAPATPEDPAASVDLAALVDPVIPVDPVTPLDQAMPLDQAALADPAANGPQAASYDLPGLPPAPDAAGAMPEDGADAQSAAAPGIAGSDQRAAPPLAQPPSDLSLIDIGTNITRAPQGSRVGRRQFRHWSFSGGRRFGAGRFSARRFSAGRFVFQQRIISFHIRNIVGCPPRLLCYAACAGPPALPGASKEARPVTRNARDHRMVVPRYLIPAAANAGGVPDRSSRGAGATGGLQIYQRRSRRRRDREGGRSAISASLRSSLVNLQAANSACGA
jgi:hypothetical protein